MRFIFPVHGISIKLFSVRRSTRTIREIDIHETQFFVLNENFGLNLFMNRLEICSNNLSDGEQFRVLFMKQTSTGPIIIGYLIFDSNGNLNFWCKMIKFDGKQLPESMIYRSVLMVQIDYDYQFVAVVLRYATVNDKAWLVNLREIRFTSTNILVHSGIVIGHTCTEQRWTFYNHRVGAALSIYKQFEQFIADTPVGNVYGINHLLIGKCYFCVLRDMNCFTHLF